MSIYGLKETLDNRPTTIVVAADTVVEFNDWFTQVQAQDPDQRHWEEIYTSSFLDGLTRPEYKGYKHHVYAFYHENEIEQNLFINQQGIVEQKSNPARDRQADMLHKHKEEVREATATEAELNQTIEEKHGLDQPGIDKWDRRSEEEMAADQKMKDEMKRLREEGSVSGDSFADPDSIRAERAKTRLKEATEGKISQTQAREQLKALGAGAEIDNMSIDDLFDALEDEGVTDVEIITDAEWDDIQATHAPKDTKGEVHVTDIRTTRDADGNISIDSIKAVKRDGPVDEKLKAETIAEQEALKAEKLAGRKSFSPDDFAAVLRGDGSGDAVEKITGDNRQTREATSRPSLSDHAEEAREQHRKEIEAAAAVTLEEQARQVAAVEAAKPPANPVEHQPLARQVTLTPKMWEQIDLRVASGHYADPSEVIREALRGSVLNPI
jgi:hypothetical protein